MEQSPFGRGNLNLRDKTRKQHLQPLPLNKSAVGFWRASPRGAGKWGGRSDLFPPHTLQNPPWLLHSQPDTDSLRCWSIPSPLPATKKPTDAPKLPPCNCGETIPEEQQRSAALRTGKRKFFLPSEAASLLQSPGKYICKKQLGRAQTTPCKLLANSPLLALPKAAICLRRLGLFRVSLQKRRSSQHARGKSLVRQPKFPCVAISERFFFAKQQKKKANKTTTTSPVD